MMRKALLSGGLSLLLLQAQHSGRFTLTIDQIMQGPQFTGYEPAQVRWSGNSQEIYFEWKPYTRKETDPMETWAVHRDGSGFRKLSDEEARLIPPARGGDISKDHRLMVYARGGDLFLYNRQSGKTDPITQTSDAEANPRFLPDGKRFAFVRGNNLFVMSLENGSLAQVTDIRSASESAPESAGSQREPMASRGARNPAAGAEARSGASAQQFLKAQERELLEAVRERAELREQDEARRRQANPRQPFVLQARQTVVGLQLSPDEKHVLAVIADAGNPKRTMIPNYITESAYTETILGRPNVGDEPPRMRMAILDTATGERKWVDAGQNGRDVQLSLPTWSADGTRAVLLGRAADNKDRWILALDLSTGKTRVLAGDHDDAWVGGPGENTLGWMKNDREVYFQSERTGFSHLYAVAYDGGEPRALTSGPWEVLNVRQSEDRSRFFLTASKDSLYEQQLYEMPGEGGPLVRLTAAPGKHAAVVSPDGHWIADVYSYTNRPPELYVQACQPQASAKKLTDSPSPEFWRHSWMDVPIVTFPARDGVQVPARLFRPANFPRHGPAVIFVHGSGYLQEADRKWSTYYREYMFHHVLMEHGFLVIDVDYRGSAGHGRQWRTAVYEHMGGKDLDDLVDAAKYLTAAYAVDPKRIGIYGGSYGGFLTLMAMFTQPDVFAAGAALRPVTDWAHYNHGYTSNILNLPQNDPEAYKRSSPIYFAGGLKGALLICHGMVDSNVEFQDTVRLAQRLIELRKTNWELAVYPVENHNFLQPTSWADEYKRILALFEKNLKG